MMIEAYAILAVFVVQILLLSVLHPAWVVRYFRFKLEGHYADARYARLFPDWGRARTERLLNLFRAVGVGIAMLGLIPLFWLFDMLQAPDWDIWAVRRVIVLYFVVQTAPLLALSLNRLALHIKARRHAPPEGKRTASLQRRRLFDFVSPVTVFVAGLAYAAAAALSFYFWRYPVPEITYPVRPLLPITYAYAVNAFTAYWLIYGKKVGLLDSEAERWRETGLGLRAMSYISIAIVVHTWFNLGLEVAHVERWIPFMGSVFYMATILIVSRALILPPRLPENGANFREAAS